MENPCAAGVADAGFGDHLRVPDVLLMRSSDPFEEIVRPPPLLCLEVLSPEDRMAEMQDKIDDSFQMGVEAIWVVDPVRRKPFPWKRVSLRR